MDFTQSFFEWIADPAAESIGLWAAAWSDAFGEHYIGVWDSATENQLALLLAEDYSAATGEAWLDRARALALKLTRHQVWDALYQEWVTYPYFSVLVIPEVDSAALPDHLLPEVATDDNEYEDWVEVWVWDDQGLERFRQ